MSTCSLSFFALAALSLSSAPSALPPQQALSPFEAATAALPKGRPPFRRMADLDLDGDVDAIGYHASIEGTRRHFEVAAYLNDGAGRFTEVWNYVQTAAVYGIDYTLVGEVGLLDADSIPDIAISFRGHRSTFKGQGNGQFTLVLQQSILTIATALALADLDGNGVSDWIWTEGWYDLNQYLTVSVAIGGAVRTLNHQVNGVHSLQVHPNDGPNGGDVFVIAGTSELEVIYFDSASGAFSQGPYFNHGIAGSMVDTGDVDGDGDIDAVIFQGQPAQYSVLRRTGPDAWTLEQPVSGGPAEFLIDVDGDGDLDGACCGGGSETPVFPDHTEPTEFQIALNTGGVFAPTFKLAGVGSPQLAGVLDVDGDGDRDLVAGRCVVFVDGAVRAPSSYPAPFASPRSPRDLSDCDGDGDVDVRFGLDSVFANDGTGRFTSVTPSVQPPPAGLVYRGPGFPGDFDGDGDVDLLVEAWRKARLASTSPRGSQGTALGMVLLANDGAGQLAAGASLASAPGVSFAVDSLAAEASLLADPDQDGDLDLVTRNLFAGARTRRWDNDGAGHFLAAGEFPGARVEWDGDIDLDGDNDLLLSRAYGTDFQLELHLGPSFALDPRVGIWLFEPHQTSLALGDLDQDGYPEFAAPCSSGNGLEATSFRNSFGAGGSLQASSELDGGTRLASGARVSLGDLDGDGDLDALVGTRSGELVTLAEVHAQGSAGAFSFAAQVLPPGLLVDLDQDGDLDSLGARITFNRSGP